MAYNRDPQRAFCLGVDFARPVDAVKAGKWPRLENVRSYQQGRIEPRPGLTDVAAVVASQTPVHSARRLNDPNAGAFAYIVGSGTVLAYGTAAFTQADTGYSGDPLALVPYRPDQSPDSWMYVADRSRMRKINRSGSVHTIGLAPPSGPPSAVIAQPRFLTIEDFEALGAWASSGTAVAPTLLSAGPGYRYTTTITAILYDSGTTGWASIRPAAASNIGRGALMSVNPGGGTAETAAVAEVHPGNPSVSTTISRIIYDSGATGACSIALTTPPNVVIELNTTLFNSTRTEYVRVLAVERGKDDLVAVRTSTTATFAAGDTVSVVPSFRIYLANNHAAAETIRTDGFRTTVTSGTGALSLTTAPDLSVIASGVPVKPDDYIHISIRVDRPDLVTEGKVMFALDATDFTNNYLYKSFRPSDLTPSARLGTGTGATLNTGQSLLSTRQRIIQRKLIDSPFLDEGLIEEEPVDTPKGQIAIDWSAVSEQLSPGDSQWAELFFRVSDLQKVGSSDALTLQNVQALRVSLTTSGTVILDVDSWWIAGGFGPDAGSIGLPYQYRYRSRVLSTGAKSNFSPPMRGGVNARRDRVTVTPSQYAAPAGTTLATTDIVLDIERFGGSLGEWHYVGTTANVASPSFTDDYPDDLVAQNPSEGQNSYQPWPVIDVPRSGTTGAVAGTTVNDAATNFNASWAPGTPIRINGILYTIYRVLSTSRLELYESAGSQNAVSWQMDEPLLLGQPLQCLWGPVNETLFACGDNVNPGRLYFANAGDPDGTGEGSWLDVTSPSEPLMNGVLYNERAYVFSTERMFQILPDGPPRYWRSQEVPNGKGLFARWLLTRIPGPVLYFGARDGIYGTLGGEPKSISDDDLLPLFPAEGSIGQTVNSTAPPNMVAAQEANLRLDYAHDYLYFDFPDTGGNRRTLLFVPETAAWLLDIYTPGIVFHAPSEGRNIRDVLCGGADATTGRLYTLGANSDNGTAIACLIQTPSRDQGDARANKLYGDIMVDIDTASVDVTATPAVNNRATLLAAVTVNTASRLQFAVSIGSAWQLGRNVDLLLSFSVSTSARPLVYLWEPRYALESAPLVARHWETTQTDHGRRNFKHLIDAEIVHVSTADLTLTVTVDGTAQAAITVANGGGAYRKTYVRFPVYKGKLLKYRISSTADWRLSGGETIFRMKEWGSAAGYEEIRPFADYGEVSLTGEAQR